VYGEATVTLTQPPVVAVASIVCIIIVSLLRPKAGDGE
jgi:hypothetical protein